MYKRVCLNVLYGNIKLTVCDTQATKTQGSASQNLQQARASLQEEEQYSTAWGISAASIECHPADAR